MTMNDSNVEIINRPTAFPLKSTHPPPLDVFDLAADANTWYFFFFFNVSGWKVGWDMRYN